MFKIVLGICAAIGVVSAALADEQSERVRCQAVLTAWAKGDGSLDSKLAFCQVEGLVSEADMRGALDAAQVAAN